MDLDCVNGMTAHIIWAILMIISCMVLEKCILIMVTFTRGNFSKINFKELGILRGLMEENITEFIKMIKKMDLESMTERKGNCIKASLKGENRME